MLLIAIDGVTTTRTGVNRRLVLTVEERKGANDDESEICGPLTDIDACCTEVEDDAIDIVGCAVDGTDFVRESGNCRMVRDDCP